MEEISFHLCLTLQVHTYFKYVAQRHSGKWHFILQLCVIASLKEDVIKHMHTLRKIVLLSNLRLLSSTGSLSIFKPLDREEQDIFNLTIIAEDHGIPQQSSTQLLCVHVIDVNDEVPWFEENQYEAQISENQPSGTSVLTVSASDLDQGETVFVCACV